MTCSIVCQCASVMLTERWCDNFRHFQLIGLKYDLFFPNPMRMLTARGFFLWYDFFGRCFFVWNKQIKLCPVIQKRSRIRISFTSKIAMDTQNEKENKSLVYRVVWNGYFLIWYILLKCVHCCPHRRFAHRHRHNRKTMRETLTIYGWELWTFS